MCHRYYRGFFFLYISILYSPSGALQLEPFYFSLIFIFGDNSEHRSQSNHISGCIIEKDVKFIYFCSKTTHISLSITLYIIFCYNNLVNIHSYYNFVFYFLNIFSLTSPIRFSLFIDSLPSQSPLESQQISLKIHQTHIKFT